MTNTAGCVPSAKVPYETPEQRVAGWRQVLNCARRTRKIFFFLTARLFKGRARSTHRNTRQTLCSTRTRRSPGRRTSTRPLTNGPPRVRTPICPPRRERPTRRAPATPCLLAPSYKSTDRPAQRWQPCRQLLRTHCLRAWRNQRRRAWRAAPRKRRAGRASKKRASRCRQVAALISQAMLAYGTLCTSLVCLQSMQRWLSMLECMQTMAVHFEQNNARADAGCTLPLPRRFRRPR